MFKKIREIYHGLKGVKWLNIYGNVKTLKEFSKNPTKLPS